jgi:rRNA maturation protein Nop10
MHCVSTLEKTKQIHKNDKNLSPLETKMPILSTYLQNCPVCGRPLEIPAEYRGRKLNCRHCGGKFTAIDPSSPVFAAQNASNALLRRADQLLELCAKKLRWRVAG